MAQDFSPVILIFIIVIIEITTAVLRLLLTLVRQWRKLRSGTLQFQSLSTTLPRFAQNFVESPAALRLLPLVTMPDWKQLQRVAGETAREIGILILVFAPLEATFSERPVSTTVIIGLVALGSIGIVGGILMEVRGAN